MRFFVFFFRYLLDLCDGLDHGIRDHDRDRPQLLLPWPQPHPRARLGQKVRRGHGGSREEGLGVGGHSHARHELDIFMLKILVLSSTRNCLPLRRWVTRKI